MTTIIKSEGIKELPVAIELIITENSKNVLEHLGLEKDQTFEFNLNDAQITVTTKSNEYHTYYSIGSQIFYDGDFPELQYEMRYDDEANNAIMSLLNSLGPMMADHKIYIRGGDERYELENTFDYMRNSIFIKSETIHQKRISGNDFSSLMGNSYGDNDEVFNKAMKFTSEKGFSNDTVRLLLFPYLSRDAVSYEVID